MGKDQSDYKGMTYEGYGPHGIAVFVDTLTDNTTRTVADVRSVFNKFGGNFRTTGSLAFFVRSQVCVTFKKKEGIDMEELILDLIDYNVKTNSMKIRKKELSLSTVIRRAMRLSRNIWKNAGFEDVGGDFTYIPNDLKDVGSSVKLSTRW